MDIVKFKYTLFLSFTESIQDWTKTIDGSTKYVGKVVDKYVKYVNMLMF